MVGFLIRFLLAQGLLFGIEMLQVIQNTLILPWTYMLARLSGSLISLVDTDVAITGKVVSSTLNGFAVSIEPGCNGVEAMLVLLAGGYFGFFCIVAL